MYKKKLEPQVDALQLDDKIDHYKDTLVDDFVKLMANSISTYENT